MATLAAAKLNISLNLPSSNAKVVVTCDIRFSRLEQFLMTHGLRFRLNCKLWGKDLGQGLPRDPDDPLFNYPTKFFPDANPTPVEQVRFEASVPLSLLNEDAGTDQIYGELILTNLEFDKVVKSRTNVVVYQFG